MAAEVELVEARVPSTWTQDPARFDLITIDEGSQEWLEQAHRFHDTVDDRQFSIKRIRRVQHLDLYRRYITVKATMQIKREKTLFHGTLPENIDDIAMEGFNRSFRGENGTVYGEGCYFARDAKYSIQYASRDRSNQIRSMFIVKVLVGDSSLGERKMRKSPVGSQSVVNCIDNPTIYVTFHDDQAYPAYIVDFAGRCR